MQAAFRHLSGMERSRRSEELINGHFNTGSNQKNELDPLKK
jgi:hypothetical protein